MKPLRIAVWHNLPSGGGKRAMYDQIKGLVERGHYVEAWCPPTANQRFLPLSAIVKERVVPLGSFPTAPKGWYAGRRFNACEAGWRMQVMEDHCRVCAEEIDAGKFDLLLVHPCVFFRASPIAKFSKLPSVLYLQEPYRELYEAAAGLPWPAPGPEYQPLSLRYWGWLTRELTLLHSKRVQVREEAAWVRSYDQVLVNSLFSRESLLRSYNVDSRVCYLGVDVSNFTPSATTGKEPFAIGLGGIGRAKRPLLAVQAIGTIAKEKRPKLVWVGNFADENYLAEVRAEANRLGVSFEQKVFISDDELHDLLRRAAVMIYVSYLEPFGYAPLEANACGTGVVAVAEGGVRETVNDAAAGVLLPDCNPEALGAAVLKFTSDLKYAAEFGRSARPYVEKNWSQEKAVNSIEKELTRVLASSHVRQEF